MTLYFVVPCYNEEQALPAAAKALGEKVDALVSSGRISADSKILFVDDGSNDKTWEIISGLHRDGGVFQGVKLSRNRGHQNALLAGLTVAAKYCDAAVSIDADLQDDLDAADKMLDEFGNGCDVVYGVRSSRKKDGFFKRNTAQGFYKFMRKMGVEIVYNHADYRLMSRRALEALEGFGEVNLFLRGIVPMIGFKSGTVYYERGERTAGESKYPLKKMLAFAFEGVTSLSIKPIRMIAALGALIFLVSIIALAYSLTRHFTGHTEIGWTSIVVSIWAIGGIQLFSIGVVGEYIGKIYLETKRRPRFIIERYLR
ncbi:MAG: glycosyltransferase family 2 protein [Oscillospiraceae bacterium]|jgi:glycosyltransferase involved in cell wall biosynthesis|nr:glycosyltransferase family 2 protein [Oscillospiraceae bacterium]